MALRSKFFAQEKMNRGELTEMMFGNKIPFYKDKNFCEDKQKKIYEVLSNNPKLIIDLIEKGYVSRNDVIDFFNIKSIHISWNEELEKKFREIVYNKRKTNSNMLKTTFFLVNIGFHKVLKEKFEEKNFKNTFSYNQREISEFSRIYDKLKKYDLQTLLTAYSKVDAIYHLREVIINDMINEIRNNYYNSKLKNFFQDKNKNKIIIKQTVNREKEDINDMKKYIFAIRDNDAWKKWPNRKINKLRFTNPITKMNYEIKEKININDISFVDKIKKTKNYIKEKIKFLQKEGKLPKNTSEKYEFNWKKFKSENSENKRIIEYFITLIQSKFRGFMVKLFLAKMVRSIDIIINCLDRYLGFKKMILSLFEIAFSGMIREKLMSEEYKELTIKIRSVIRIILRNCRNHILIIKKPENDFINKLYENDIISKPINIDKVIYSVKLLLFLDNCLFFLYHEYMK